MINGLTFQVDTTLSMTWNLRWNRINNKLYCCLYWPLTVRVVNCQNNQIVASIVVGSGPRPLVWDSIDNRVCVGCYDGKKIAVLRDEMGIAESNLDKVWNYEKRLIIQTNPFANCTKLTSLGINNDSQVITKIYDIKGELLRSFLSRGGEEIIWDVRNESRNRLKAGVYFAQLGTNLTLNKI